MHAVPSTVWLNGRRAGVHHRMDLETGRVLRTVRLGTSIPGTAGMAGRCGGRFVAVFLHPDGGRLVLQTGRRRIVLDDTATAVSNRTWFAGLGSTLVVTCPTARVVLRDFTPGRAIFRKIDPAYDELDESMDDFLGGVADLAGDLHRQEWFRRIKDPFGEVG